MKNSWKSGIEMLVRGMAWSAPLAVAVAAVFMSGAGTPVFPSVLALLPLVGLAAIFATGEDGGGGDEEDEDESAQTIVAMPVWMIEEMAKKREEAKKKRELMGADPEPEAEPEPEPEPEPESEPEPEAPAVSVEAEGPTDEVDLGTAQTMMFDPSAAVDAGEQAAAAPPAAEEDLGTAQTLMFDPQDAVKAQEEIEKAREQTTETEDEPEPHDDAIGETAVYSADEVARLREQAVATAEAEVSDEVDGEARTMMYMPAQESAAPGEAEAPAEAPAPAQPEDDAHAPTRVYMEAVGDDAAESTMAYSPEDREELLEKMAKKGVDGAVAETEPEPEAEEVDTAGATQVYSAEESAQFKDAYDLLRKPGVDDVAPEVPETKTVTAPEMKRVQEPDTISAMAPVQGAGGVGAGTVVFLLALLAVAGAATAVILHLFGVVELPLDLPTLDL